MNLAKNDKAAIDSDKKDCEDKTIKKLHPKNLNRAVGYLTPQAELTFTQWKKKSITALILWHFNLKCHIQIKTDVSKYTIGGVLS